MKRKQFKLSPEAELLFAFLSLILLILYFSSCNPVKKVLKSPAYFNVVRDTVLARGYCANDTSIFYITDTLEVTDTIVEIYTDTLKFKDTTYLWETKFHTVTKVRTIRDSVKLVVIDSARINVLRKELKDSETKLKAALGDQKGLKKIMFLMGGGSLLFFLLLFKLR
jgi:hypothetical protein